METMLITDSSKSLCEGTMKPWIHNAFHPCDTERDICERIFLMFDLVHILKCFYNNFMNQELFLCPSFTDEDGELHGDFSHIKHLYNHIKSHKAFIQFIQALKYYANNGFESFSETADVLQIFRNWFNAVNVKSLYSAQRTRDVYKSAITKEDRGIVIFFSQFVSWLEKWEMPKKPVLSKQTFAAALQTTKVLIHLPSYLLDDKCFDILLLGNEHSDFLEGRFCWYRQSSGVNYHVSVLQVLQSEKIIRTRSLINQGFKMSKVKKIFSSVSSSAKTESDVDLLSKRVSFEIENIQFHIAIQRGSNNNLLRSWCNFACYFKANEVRKVSRTP